MVKGLLTCMFLLTPCAALAQDSGTEITFFSCQTCHGSGGDGAIPAIEGRPYDALLAKLNSFAGDGGGATIMHRFTAGLTEAELESLARYASEQKGAGQ